MLIVVIVVVVVVVVWSDLGRREREREREIHPFPKKAQQITFCPRIAPPPSSEQEAIALRHTLGQ